MANKLRKLVLDRVDLVPEGSNPDSHIVLMKSKDPIDKTTFNDIRDSRQLQKMLSEVCQYTWDLYDAVSLSLYGDGDRVKEVQTSIKQYSKAVDEALASWSTGNPVAMEKINDALTGLAKAREELTAVKEALVSEPVKKTEETKVEDTPVVKTTDIPAHIQKALDDQAAQIAKANEEIAKANALAAKAQEEARVEKEKRETAEFITKAKSDIPNLTGTDVEKGAIIQKVFAKLEKADADKVMDLLKTGDKAVGQLLGTEIGKRGENEDEGAVAELNKKAEDIRKADTKLSKHQAFRRACSENPEIYRRYQQERNSRVQ